MSERIDCAGPEPNPGITHHDVCRWCGRPIKYRDGRWVHRRGWRRVHDDPRRQRQAGTKGGGAGP